MTKQQAEQQAPTFTKAQIVRAEQYRPYQDVLSALLYESKSYTHEEVQDIIKNFLKGEVK